jgi:uncharacterized membrane protein
MKAENFNQILTILMISSNDMEFQSALVGSITVVLLVVSLDRRHYLLLH